VAGPRGLLVALDAASGRELWRCDLAQQLQAKMPHYGFGASPILVGERLVLQVGGPDKSGLVAFEAATGRVVWSTQPSETKGDSTGYTMATPADIGGVPQLVAMGHDRVFSVRSEDGSLLWSHALAEPEEPTRAVLPLPDSHVLLSRFSGAILLKVTREGETWKVSQVWQSPRLKNSYSPNVHDGGFLYGFSGQFLLCVDAATGEPRWRQKVNSGSLIRVGRHLVVLGEQSGLVRIVEATPAAYRLVAEASVFNAGALSSTGPSYAGGRIFVRNTEEMVALALEGGPARAAAREVRP
jgi:outer membrane protein assembly factor BamB